MKQNKIFSIMLVLFVLSFIFSGCGFLPETVTGAITGQVKIPASGETAKDISGWVPAAGAEVTIVDADGVTHTVIADKDGYYSFENIAVNPNTVITATVEADGKTIVLKKVIPVAVAEDENYDSGAMTPEDTALALVVEGLVNIGMDPVEIDLDEIKNTNSFEDLVEQVTTAIEEGKDVTEDSNVTDGVDETVDEIINPPAPPYTPPTPSTPSTPAETPAKYFEFNKDTGTITGYKDGGPKDVVIPARIDGVAVETIGDYAFYGNDLKSVTIPKSVKTIGDYAFRNNNLTELTIGNKVKTIGAGAFWSNDLKSATIPVSVTRIGAYAFKSNSLTELIIGSKVETIGEEAFYENDLKSVTIPDSVTSIREGTFANNNLTSLTIPVSVTSIGAYAFVNNNLTELTIGNKVKTIGDYAFSENDLESVTILDSVKTIGDYAFRNNNLTSVTIGNSVTKIGVAAFNYNQLPDEQAFIYARHFNGAEDNTTVVSYGGIKKEDVQISDSVKTIGDYAFSENDLKSVTIPDSVKTIGDYSFYTNSLESVTIPDSVTSIGARAFQWNNLTLVTIPNSVTMLGEGVFEKNGEGRNSGNIPTSDYVGTWETVIESGETVWIKQ